MRYALYPVSHRGTPKGISAIDDAAWQIKQTMAAPEERVEIEGVIEFNPMTMLKY